MGFIDRWNRLWDRGRRGGRQPARLRLECLEVRTVPTIFFVSTSGADMAGGGQANPFRSIQYAVNQASTAGDEIHVAAGTYTHADDANAYTIFNDLGSNGVV